MRIIKNSVGHLSIYLVQNITKHKTLEVGCQLTSQRAISLRFDVRSKRDHGGLMCSVQIWRLFAELNLCDIRHWNDKENRYFDINEPYDVDA